MQWWNAGDCPGNGEIGIVFVGTQRLERPVRDVARVELARSKSLDLDELGAPRVTVLPQVTIEPLRA